MSAAFLYGVSGASGFPDMELERFTSDWSYANETTVTPTHDGKCVYVILTGGDYDGYVMTNFYIDGTKVENTQYDFIIRSGSAPCGVLFVLCVKNGNAYDLCRLDGTVVRAQAENFKVKNFSHGLYVAILKAAE